MTRDKIRRDAAALADELAPRRAAGETVVTANGCFELLHVGHVRYLDGAKALGDILVVAVNSDASMDRIKREPIVPDEERYEMIAALDMVDYVVPLEDDTPVRVLEALRPDVHAKGTDYTPEAIPERAIVESHGGRVAIAGDPKDHSTSDMIAALRRRRG